jgi:CRISPR-associated protein (TIGR03986 family)
MALEHGVLIVRVKKGSGQSIQIQIGEKPVMNIAEGEVSQSLLNQLDTFNGKEVEFERVGGQPKKVREAGGSFISPGQVSDRTNDSVTSGRGSHSGRPQERQQPMEHAAVQRDFHNPYNFIPAPPRNIADPDLGDHAPAGQDAFYADLYSGVIRVRMTAKTPLLVPDTERAQESNGHKTYPLLVDTDGKPRLPASSIRGMLRSAYEAVTNSRFGRFSQSQHGDRLAFRMATQEGLRLIPARVENGHLQLLTGTSGIDSDGRPNGPIYAAWLPRYSNGQVGTNTIRYSDGNLPQHGDEVMCWIEKIQHLSPNFIFWRVRNVARGSDPVQLPPQPDASQATERSAPAKPAEMRRIHGWVCITNANINRKHDERVFFSDNTQAPGPFPITEKHCSKWRELIQNYQSIHVDDLRRRSEQNQRPDQYLGREPGQTAWSRHIYTVADRELTDGTLCYVRLDSSRSDIEAIFPVMIARELYPESPWDLLPDSLRPATTIDQLSPADRVFGWVKVDAETGRQSRNERVAARALLRISPVQCESSIADAVETFTAPGVPLAILAAPKPQQGRFYVAQSQNGEAQSDKLPKADTGCSHGKGLRGRKVYPHQGDLPGGHWDNPTEDRTQPSRGHFVHYQEYRRPGKDNYEQRDDQNRSILGWVKPGAQFVFKIFVQNLSSVELGALLWLLDLPQDHFFRFGGGKPFGFGSVWLEIESCDLHTGNQLRNRYRLWHDESPLGDPRSVATNAFKSALVRAYPPEPDGFEGVLFIKAFLTACKGYEDKLPTHYPRATADGQPGPPSPQGESFKWFVANERDGAHYALCDLADDVGLPTLSDLPRRGGQGSQGNNQNRRRSR